MGKYEKLVEEQRLERLRKKSLLDYQFLVKAAKLKLKCEGYLELGLVENMQKEVQQFNSWVDENLPDVVVATGVLVVKGAKNGK